MEARRPLVIRLPEPLRPYEIRAKDKIRGIVVHRIEVSQEDAAFPDTPEGIARFFAEHPIGREATGGKMPYPILIGADGTVTQTLPLGWIAPHARAFNPSTVGVAGIGDFRGRAPTSAQRDSLVHVCGSLARDFALPPAEITGHDELSGGSRDPEKECPGRLLPMDLFRQDVRRWLDAGVEPMLEFAWDW